MTEFVLKTNQLTKKFKHDYALEHVNVSIKKGEIYGFIGQNGAGKSTFLRLVTIARSRTVSTLRRMARYVAGRGTQSTCPRFARFRQPEAVLPIVNGKRYAKNNRFECYDSRAATVRGDYRYRSIREGSVVRDADVDMAAKALWGNERDARLFEGACREHRYPSVFIRFKIVITSLLLIFIFRAYS